MRLLDISIVDQLEDTRSWIEEVLGERKTEEMKRYLARMLEIALHFRKERDEFIQEVENAKDVLSQMEAEKKQLNDRWMSTNEQGLEKIKSDMEQLKNIMTQKTPRVPTLPLPAAQSVSETSTSRAAEWSRRKGATSTSTGALSARLDNLCDVLEKIENQVAS